jgi:hypothetical protein
VLSLSIRLFGNIFGEELVIVILFSIVPFLVPLPMMFLGLITGGLQAFIFVLLSIVYLQGAVRRTRGRGAQQGRSGACTPDGVPVGSFEGHERIRRRTRTG